MYNVIFYGLYIFYICTVYTLTDDVLHCTECCTNYAAQFTVYRSNYSVPYDAYCTDYAVHCTRSSLYGLNGWYLNWAG